ncbi:MAG: non-homologous end-joining DNA ligase [Caldimonas sp.]
MKRSPVATAILNTPKALLPEALSPQLATLASAPPTVGDWGYEIKFDGYRILARVDKGRCRLFTRSGNDWTDKMKSLATLVAGLPLKSGWLDCEAVVLGANGVPSFNALQNAFDRVGAESILLFIFDVPYLEGHDLRALPLRARRSILQQVLSNNVSERIKFSEDFGGVGVSVLESACKMGLEGVVAKRQDSLYVLRRSETWLKLKCNQRQEFVVGGFTDRSDAPNQVGSLLLGVYDDAGKLRLAGSVGTGWSTKDGALMWSKLIKLETATSPFDAQHKPTKGRWSRRALGSERWVKPTLVAEVTFAEWTPDGSVRHASFEGLREDKKATSIKRETAMVIAQPVPLPKKSSASSC